MSSNGKGTATVETLTAEVRVLMVGSRQVTLSVYNQLDLVPHARVEPFGRVNPKEGGLWVVGRDSLTGTLVRSVSPQVRDVLNKGPFTKGATKLMTEAIARQLEATRGVGHPDFVACRDDLTQVCARLVGARLADELRCLQVLRDVGDQLKIDSFHLTNVFRAQLKNVSAGGYARWEAAAGTVDRKADLLTKGYRVAVMNAEDKVDEIRQSWSDLPLIVLAGLR